jgi:endonuclease YncB( thermonuclease family)
MSVGVVVGLALLAAGVIGFLLGRQHTPAPPSTPAAAPPAEARRATPTREQQLAAHRLAGWRVEPVDPLAPAGERATNFEPVLRPTPPYDAVDATLFDAFDMRIRLAHAWPVGRDEACLDPRGLRFACGLRARAALQNHLFGKTVTCIRLFLAQESDGGVVDARCTVEGEDLALRQIRAGWAFPNDLADADQRAALEDAQRERAGVWAGPYELPHRDLGIDDAREVPFGSLRNPGQASAR